MARASILNPMIVGFLLVIAAACSDKREADAPDEQAAADSIATLAFR